VRLGRAAPLRVDFLRASPLLLADEVLARSGSCQLCRGALRPGRRVYRCACGSLCHAEPAADAPEAPSLEAESLEESLDCAFGVCTACERAIDVRSGYAYSDRLPEEARGPR